MKCIKRVLALTLAAFIAAGLLAPMPAEAAASIKGKVRFDWWNGVSSCYFVGLPKLKGADKYQYKVYFNNKKLKKTSGKISISSDDYFEDGGFQLAIKGLPKYSCCYVSVRVHRNGAWTKWSPKLLLIPKYLSNCIKPKEKIDTKKKTCKVSWRKITGITNYDLYLSTNGTKWKKVKSFTKSDKTSYTFKNANGKKFKDNTVYHYKIIAKRKVGGKWVRSIGVKESISSGWFGFNLEMRE